ncbi:hypothetical protein GARCT_02558 [Geobacillus sp. 12AMOR1]|nr:hypothetical protein GARCT_02558 [Geobacillus sp. 12AMOR1]
MSQYEEEKKKAYEQYEKHKCRTCIWSRWQVPFVVTCLFPRCVIEVGWCADAKQTTKTMQ